MGSVKRLNNTAGPWDNFPNFNSNVSEENKFTRRFALAYSALRKRDGTGIREFPVADVGIADLIWIDCKRRGKKPATPSITAFEIKVKDWKSGLRQAYRYSFFADLSYLVVPEELAPSVSMHINVFQNMGIGAMAFSKDGNIRSIYEPPAPGPKSLAARARAIKTLRSEFNLCFFEK
jgi:hypothetical protein